MILGAGMGTRMRSGLPKILHRVAGDPIVLHVLDAAARALVPEMLLVVGHRSEDVMAALGDQVRYVLQEPQLGTGHAVQQAVRVLDPIPDRVLVLCGDTPLLTPRSISDLVAGSGDATITLLSAHLPDPTGYGRILREATGRVVAIVEEADASQEIRSLSETNSGLYCFDGEWLSSNLPLLKKSPRGEYYLTDLVAMAVAQGRWVRAVIAEDAAEVIGVNTRAQLAEAERVMRDRLCRELMANGVTIVDPASTYLGKDVRAGADTVIQPGTHLRGKTIIGDRCEIGPNTIIVDSTLGDDCVVIASMVEKSRLADRVSVGPFAHLRPGAEIDSDVRLGNYAEVKNSRLGSGVQMHHFSYVGDADLGAGTNVGAGTITCNYDGRRKHRTKIGRKVFLGSDTLLVAPVELGDEARTGAGAVVTRDVPPGKLVVGMPARPIRRRERRDAGSDDSGRTTGGESGG